MSKLQEMQDKIDDLCRQSISQDRHIIVLNNRRAADTAALANAQKQLKAEQSKVRVKRNLLRTKTDALADQTRRFNALGQKFNENQGHCLDFARRVKKAEKKYEEMKRHAKAAGEIGQAEREANVALAEDVRCLRNRIQNTDNANKELRRRNSNQTGACRQYREESEALTREIQSLRHQVALQSATIQASEKSCGGYHQVLARMTAAQEQVVTLRGSIRLLKDEVESYRKGNVTLADAEIAANHEVARLKEQVTDIGLDNSAKHTQARRKNAMLSSDNDRMREHVVGVNARNQNLQHELGECQVKLKACDNTSLHDEYVKLSRENDDLCEHIDELKTEHSKDAAIIMERKCALDAIRMQLGCRPGEVVKTIIRLQNDRNKYATQNGVLKTEHTKDIEVIQELHRKLKYMNPCSETPLDINSLKATLDVVAGQRDRLKLHVNGLKVEIAGIEGRNERLQNSLDRKANALREKSNLFDAFKKKVREADSELQAVLGCNSSHIVQTVKDLKREYVQFRANVVNEGNEIRQELGCGVGDIIRTIRALQEKNTGLEAAYNERVRYVASMSKDYSELETTYAALVKAYDDRKRLDFCLLYGGGNATMGEHERSAKLQKRIKELENFIEELHKQADIYQGNMVAHGERLEVKCEGLANQLTIERQYGAKQQDKLEMVERHRDQWRDNYDKININLKELRHDVSQWKSFAKIAARQRDEACSKAAKRASDYDTAVRMNRDLVQANVDLKTDLKVAERGRCELSCSNRVS